MKHIRSLFDLRIDEFQEILTTADELKRTLARGERPELLKNRALALLFEKASLRTRVSFEAGMIQLGGSAIYLTHDAGWKERETISDFVHVLAEYCDFLVCRAISQSTVDELASYDVLPIINGLTDQSHPCQAIADFMTMRECLPDLEGKQLTFVGDGNNVARSLLKVCAMGRMKFRLAGPIDYHIQPQLIDRVRDTYGWVDFDQCTDAAKMIRSADFVYTDVWTSMGQESEAQTRKAAFAPYQLNTSLLANTPDHCKIMHCLPARRGQEITDEVIDSLRSVVIQQAGNRMHLQKGLLVWLARQNQMI